MKALVIQHLRNEIRSAVESADVLANRCWRRGLISKDKYKTVLREHDSNAKYDLLLSAVEASIRDEEARFDVFLEILEGELEPSVAKTLISKILAHLQEVQERRASIDQCTEKSGDSAFQPNVSSRSRTQNEATRVKGGKEETSVEYSSSTNDNSQGSVSQVSNLRRRRVKDRQTGHTKMEHVQLSENKSSEVEPIQENDEEPSSSDESHEVEPVEATDTSPPCTNQRNPEHRQLLCNLQERTFAHYDRLQLEERCRELTKTKELLEKQLDEQSVDYYNRCDEKKQIEKELEEIQSEVVLLKKDQEEAKSRHEIELEQLRSQVANSEREKQELEVKSQEYEQEILEIMKAYDTKLSRRGRTIHQLQEKLKASDSIIREKNQEIVRLHSCIAELQYQRRRTETDKCRNDVMEYKSNRCSLLIAVVVVRGLIELLIFFWIVKIYFL